MIINREILLSVMILSGTHLYIVLARIRLLGRFTTCLVQTKNASRLLFAIGWHFMPRECEFFLEIFEFKIFLNFVPL